MSKLHLVEVGASDVPGRDLAEHVQLSLTEIVGAAKEGLLALAAGTGLAVLHATMEYEVERWWGRRAACRWRRRPG